MKIDMAGLRYAEVVAIRPTKAASSGDMKWELRCDCGTVFEANGYAVRSGKVTSCPACARRRTTLASVKHGRTETPEYETWCGIRTRCGNSNRDEFKDYGGRGITVCDRWLESFENFFADMGPRPSAKHSIERKDNDGNYEPGNCVWATDIQQASNKRSNVFVTIDGVTKTLSEWSRHYGVDVATASLRRKNGREGEAIFKTGRRLLTHNGVTDTVAAWSKRTGIKPTTISMRVNQYRWSESRALTEGAKL